MRRVDEFSIGCAENGDYIIHEHGCAAYPAASLRKALTLHLEALRSRGNALAEILGTAVAEEAEALLVDSTRMRVDEVTLRAPATPARFDAIMRRFKEAEDAR
jgi:hypothetical protein